MHRSVNFQLFLGSPEDAPHIYMNKILGGHKGRAWKGTGQGEMGNNGVRMEDGVQMWASVSGLSQEL